MERLGVYGGTFDPIHMAHLIIAEQAREQLRLDRVLFVPSGNPPHKVGRSLPPAQQRAEMVRLAIAGNPHFSLCDFEIKREAVSYTVDTLMYLRETHPDAELFLLLGADNLPELHRWRQPEKIASLAHLCFAGRPGTELNLSLLAGIISEGMAEDVRTHQLTTPLLEISSSDIRQRIREGRSIRYLVPAAIDAYISAHKLYEK